MDAPVSGGGGGCEVERQDRVMRATVELRASDTDAEQTGAARSSPDQGFEFSGTPESGRPERARRSSAPLRRQTKSELVAR